MKHLRLFVSGAALAVTIAGTSLTGRVQQPAPPAAVPAAPFDALHFRPIGPASMSGRISDLAVYEANPSIFYAGTAHGGVWKTTNNGTTFEAQFQDQGLMSIGDVTVSQSNPDLVWVGTGESNNRQSTSWGDGVYKSIDGGKTWTHMGLRTSRHVNRIVIDARNNDTVFVAATGALWGPGGDRGVYKTVDGGKTWKQVLKVDDDTGANDLVMDPADNRTLYAAMYQRRRTACCMNGGGAGSGIWKSTDAGETWTKLKGDVLNGALGRITLDVYRRRPNILYALIEGPAQPGAGRGAGGGGGRGQQALNLSDPTGLYRSDDAGATWRKVNNANPRPMYFSQVRIDPNDPEVLYLGGVDLHQSLDGGKTMNTQAASRIHSDHHAIWINPMNSDHVIIGNDGGLAYSYDKSKKWVFVPNLPVGLFYHLSYDMAMPYNICGGMQDNYNWCGPSAVRGAAGIANHHWTTIQGGDGFVVLQDPTDYRIAFSESQDGNMVRVDRVTGESISIRPTPAPGEPALRWHWDTPLVQSPHDSKVIFAAANKVFRSADRGLSWTAVSGDLTDGANRDDIVTMGVKGSEIRFSRNDGIQAWPAIVAFAESPKRAGLYYAGTDDGNLQLSRDAGKTWTKVFDKLQGAPKGVFISEVVPSKFAEGTVYATLDGHRQNDYETYIYASTDFGATWNPLAGNLKGEVARTLTEDVKNPDVLYLGTETGLFVSLDRGRNWQRVKANLPTVRIDEIVIHPRDNALLLATHGRAIWVLDHLEPIQEYAAAMQTTADARLFTPPPFAWYQRPARDRNYEFWGDQTFFGENPPQAAVLSWLNRKQVGDVKLRITDAAGREVREISGPVLSKSTSPGIQSACWDLRVQPVPALDLGGGPGRQGGAAPAQATPPSPAQSEALPTGPVGQQTQLNLFGAGCGGAAGGGGGGGGFGGFGGGGASPGPYVLPGVYTVSLVVDGKTMESRPLRAMADKEVVLTEAERKRLYDIAMELHALQRRANDAAAAILPVTRQMAAVIKQVTDSTSVPADVKTQVETFNKELTALAAKLTPPQGGRGGGGGGRGGDPTPISRLGQAKNGVMGGMWPTQATMSAYTEAKTSVPAAVAEVEGVLSKGRTLSAVLAKHNVTLSIAAPAARLIRSSNNRSRSEVESMRMTSRTLPGVLISAVLTTSGPAFRPAAAAGQGSHPGTRVIVRAVTAAGEPITDLKKEEVSVRTDGRQREVTDLTMILISSESATVKAAATSSLPPPYASNIASAAPAAAADSREFVVLLDEESISAGREQPVRDALNLLISRLTPRDRVGLIGMRIGGITIAPTPNHESLKAAIGKFAGGGTARETANELACRTKRALDTLTAVFSDAPAGRTIVVVSSGLAPTTTQQMSTMQGQSADTCQVRSVDLERLGAAAGASAGNVYVLYYPDGLGTTALASTAQQGLENVAGTTNGEFIRITGASETAATRIARETSVYYIATLDSAGAGAVKRVDGRVAREGARALIRPIGAVAAATPATAKAMTPREMLTTTATFTQVPLRAAGLVSRQGTSDMKLMAFFEPGEPSIKLTAASVGLVDEKGTVKSQWSAKPEELERSPITAALPIAPGKYRVRVAATTATAGGAVDFDIVAGLQEAAPLKFGGMMLGVTSEKGFAPKLQFGRTDTMAVGVAEVYGVPKGTNVTVQFEIAQSDAAQPRGAAAGNVQNGPTEDARVVFGGFSIETLEPGDYVMRAIVSIDGKVAGAVTRTLRKVTN